MCFAPKIPKPTEPTAAEKEAAKPRQAAKAPVTRAASRSGDKRQNRPSGSGRGGTILTDGGAAPSVAPQKKTLLGQ